MSFAAPLFFALSDADSPMLLWLIVGGLMALGPVIHSYIKVYEWFKGTATDTSQFITRAEFSLAKAERDTQIADSVEHFNKTSDQMNKRLESVFSLIAELQRDMPAIHRALGRLEGHDDATLKRPR